MTHVELLQNMPLFGGVSKEAIEFLLEHMTTMRLAAGESFFAEEESGTAMYVLEQGEVELVRNWRDKPRRLAVLGAGDCFGEMALMDFQRRSATARALTDCEALEISVADLHGLYKRDLEQFTIIQMNMGREVSRRLRAADEHWIRAEFGRDRPADRDSGFLS